MDGSKQGEVIVRREVGQHSSQKRAVAGGTDPVTLRREAVERVASRGGKDSFWECGKLAGNRRQGDGEALSFRLLAVFRFFGKVRGIFVSLLDNG